MHFFGGGGLQLMGTYFCNSFNLNSAKKMQCQNCQLSLLNYAVILHYKDIYIYITTMQD